MRQALPTCRVCDGAIPEQANYCPSCGIRLLEDDPLAAPPKVRLFGVVSPLAMFVLACVLLVGAIVAFATSGPILAIMLLAGAGAVFVLFYGAVERDRSSAVARGAVKTKERVRAVTTVTTSSARAWSTAGRDVLRLRRELRTLRRERAQLQERLGDAAFREDEPAVEALKTRMVEIDQATARAERERTEALARARRTTEDERAAARRTEVLAPDDADRGGASES